MKNLLYLFLSSSLLWTFGCPGVLSASDSVILTGLDNSNIVETFIPDTFTPVITPVVTPVTVVSPAPVVQQPTPVIVTPAKTPETPVETTTPAPILAPAPTVPADNITINGRTIGITAVDSTTRESGNGVNKIGKLLYGHNSSAVFGDLDTLTIGSTFTITENGETKTYQVSKITTYEKNPDGRLQLGGSGSYMKAIRDRALGHSVAIMTCAGTSYGNGDASHRLVIFADII